MLTCMDCPFLVELLMVAILTVFGFQSVRCANSVFSSERNPYCWTFECCNEEWILQDVNALKENLSALLYGQHLVEDTLVRSLTGHVKYGSEKPLVFSFHGSCGIGKSFVSKLIAKSWFKEGILSKYFNLMIGTKDYPFKNNSLIYKQDIQKMIERQVRSCPYQLFIFEEVDSFPPELLNALTPFLTSYEVIDGVDYRKSIFILISNTGQESINRLTEENYNRGLPRKSLTIKGIEGVLEKEIYNSTNTGLSGSKLIDRYFISYFMPFLPLEREHVKMCAERILKQRLGKSFNADLVDRVMDELSFRDPKDNFSQKGCKNVDEKVNYILGGETLNRVEKLEL